MFPGGDRRMNARERMLYKQRAADDARGDLQRYTRNLSSMTAANQRGNNIGSRIRSNQSAIRASEAMFADQRRAVRGSCESAAAALPGAVWPPCACCLGTL